MFIEANWSFCSFILYFHFLELGLKSVTTLNFAAYCVVAKESAPKHVSVAFLERLKADFKKRYGGGKADTAAAKSLNKEFGYLLYILIFFIKLC